MQKNSNSMDKLLLPRVLFIGPQRTGTTWIYEYFRSRKDITLPEGLKETWFFSKFYYKGVKWYASYFKPKVSCKSIVEVDPTLFSHPEAPKRVYDTIGSDVLIICTLRDPVERSISHYRHAKRYGWTKKPLTQALRVLPEIIDESCYTKHLKKWFSIFGRSRVLIFFYEELAQKPDMFVERLCSTMKIPYISIPNHLKKRVNKSVAPRFLPLIRTLTPIAMLAHSYRIYKIIGLAKHMGFKKVFYRALGGGEKDQVEDEACRILTQKLKKENESIEKFLGRNVPFNKRFQ